MGKWSADVGESDPGQDMPSLSADGRLLALARIGDSILFEHISDTFTVADDSRVISEFEPFDQEFERDHKRQLMDSQPPRAGVEVSPEGVQSNRITRSLLET